MIGHKTSLNKFKIEVISNIFSDHNGIKLDINYKEKKKEIQTFSQDGGVGRYTLPPHTTKRRTTTNLETKNNPTCQKIELYGSLTIRELKKKHASRPVGDGGTVSRGREDSWQGGSWRVGAGEVAAGEPGCPTFVCR